MANEFNIKNGFISNSNSIVLGAFTATTISATTYLNLPSNGGSFTGGTVSGATYFTNGLTANTISATTYYNLPPDLWSQSGSSIYYNGGNVGIGTASPQVELHVKGDSSILRLETTSATNNNYVEFWDPTERKGFFGYVSTAYIDSLFLRNEEHDAKIIISSTDSGGTSRTAINIDGNHDVQIPNGNFEVVGNTNIMGTLNVSDNTTLNNITATTISATTYLNLPSDIRVTGATYSNNTFNFTNNTGGTFNILFNTVTGLTVNGSVSANTVYVVSATTGTSVANLAIQSDGKIIKTGGNAIVDNFYYSISNTVDTRPIFEDDKVKFNWDETGNDLEFHMKVAPGGSGDMRSLAYLVGGSTQNTAIVSTGVAYDIYAAGVSAGNRLEAFITAENDVTYPAYHVTVYNTGESFHNTIWIERITSV